MILAMESVDGRRSVVSHRGQLICVTLTNPKAGAWTVAVDYGAPKLALTRECASIGEAASLAAEACASMGIRWDG